MRAREILALGRDIGGRLAGLVLCPPFAVIRLVAAAPLLGLRDVVFYVKTSERVVALTLDDGPDPEVTPLVLDILSKHNAHATFFLIGSRINSPAHAPDIHDVIKRIADDGHELGNHTWADQPTVRLSQPDLEESLARTDHALAAFGPVRLLRPGSGWPSRKIVSIAGRHGYRCVLGSVYPNDLRVRSTRLIVNWVLSRVRPGAIIILHEGAPGRERLVGILDELLREIGRRNYRVTTVSDLLGLVKT